MDITKILNELKKEREAEFSIDQEFCNNKQILTIFEEFYEFDENTAKNQLRLCLDAIWMYQLVIDALDLTVPRKKKDDTLYETMERRWNQVFKLDTTYKVIDLFLMDEKELENIRQMIMGQSTATPTVGWKEDCNRLKRKC